MRPTNPTETHLPVPATWRQLTDAIASGPGVRIDRSSVTTFVDSAHAERDPRQARKYQRLLDHLGDSDALTMGPFGVTTTTGRLVETGPFRASSVIGSPYEAFEAREGRILLDISPFSTPWAILAHLSGDPVLEAAVTAGDVYGYLAKKCPGYTESRSMVKMVLFSCFRGGPYRQVRQGASGQLEQLLRKLMPALYAYIDATIKATGGLDHVHVLQARTCTDAVVEAWMKVARYARPVFLHMSSDLYCEVDESDRDFVLERLAGFTPTPPGPLPTPTVDITVVPSYTLTV